MSGKVDKIIKLIIGTICVVAGVYVAVILLIGTPVDSGELIAGIIMTVSLIPIGLFLLALGLWEEKILKWMYGDFSNRNPWGR